MTPLLRLELYHQIFWISSLLPEDLGVSQLPSSHDQFLLISFNNVIPICCPLSFCPQSFPALGLFQWVSCSYQVTKYWSFSISPFSEYLVLTSFKIDLIFLLSKGLSSIFSRTTVRRHQFFSALPSLTVQLSQLYLTTGKIIALPIQTFVGKVISLLFNMLSRFIIAFLPWSRHLISWLQSPSAVILESKKRKSSTFSPSTSKVMELDALIFVFLMFSFKPAFQLSSFTLIKRFFSSSSLSAIRVV